MLGTSGPNIAGQTIGVQRDNWKHRSQGMKCLSCMWFVEKARRPKRVPGPNEEAPTEGDSEPFGRCRKRAPTLSGWPAMFGTDWCGDHKLDENKR